MHDLHLRARHAGVFGVSAVELPAHAAHCCRNYIAVAELAAWCTLYKTDGFDAEHAREYNVRGVTLPRK